VEFAGGDQLPGEVVAFQKDGQNGAPIPPHLVVTPVYESPAALQGDIRVRIDDLRRVVWEARTPQRYEPQTAFLMDGRRIPFRVCRWNARSVSLLTSEGTTEIAFDDIAELHLPVCPPWESHFRRLAVLTPTSGSMLVQVEAIGGHRLTTSLERFHPLLLEIADKKQQWVHLIQPAWSLDAIAIPHRYVRQRTFFAPHEVPLSWIEPSASRHRAFISAAWATAQTDRNVRGEALHSGALPWGWGIGVQAQHELEFPLPACATAFRTRVGLDTAAHSGGCVCARITLGTADNQRPAASDLPGRTLF
jgi:hypothetical protein